MRYSSRFFLYAPLIVFLAIAGWSMLHWWNVATAFDAKLTALNGYEAIPGVTISYASKTISGFPFRVDAEFTGFSVKGAGAHGPFAWQSEHFALHTLPYGRVQGIYEAAGRQSLSWTDAAGTAHHIAFLPGVMRASTIADAKGLSRFDLDIRQAGGKDSDGKNFTLARAQFHLRRNPSFDTVDVMASADDAKLAERQIHSLQAYATLTHRGAWAPLLAGSQSWPDADAAWRKAGGAAQMGKQEITPAMDGVIDAILNPLY